MRCYIARYSIPPLRFYITNTEVTSFEVVTSPDTAHLIWVLHYQIQFTSFEVVTSPVTVYLLWAFTSPDTVHLLWGFISLDSEVTSFEVGTSPDVVNFLWGCYSAKYSPTPLDDTSLEQKLAQCLIRTFPSLLIS